MHITVIDNKDIGEVRGGSKRVRVWGEEGEGRIGVMMKERKVMKALGGG